MRKPSLLVSISCIKANVGSILTLSIWNLLLLAKTCFLSLVVVRLVIFFISSIKGVSRGQECPKVLKAPRFTKRSLDTFTFGRIHLTKTTNQWDLSCKKLVWLLLDLLNDHPIKGIISMNSHYTGQGIWFFDFRIIKNWQSKPSQSSCFARLALS